MSLDLRAHTVALDALASADPSVGAAVRAKLHAAFGPAGPGILLVDGLPPTFSAHRAALTRAALPLAALPDRSLAALEFPRLDYALGWSCARETFDSQPDTHKASFYANPLYDDPSLGDAALVRDYPHYMHPNRWPDTPCTAALRPSFRAVGALIQHAALHIAGHIDDLLRAQRPQLCAPSLRALLARSRSAKGRLLHYFPTTRDAKPRLWCGFHNDHGLLTGLLCAQFFNAAREPVPNTDPQAGLYVAPSSGGPPLRVAIPPHALAFQIGETAQILTGGMLRATAHGVRPPADASHLARVTLAMFMQPDPWDILRVPVDRGADTADTGGNSRARQLSDDALAVSELVPALRKRFRDGLSFDEFAKNTFAEYH